MYQTLSKPGGGGRRARGGKEGVPQTTPTSLLPSSQETRAAPGGSLPFDLSLPGHLCHILMDLIHRKTAARGTEDARCSSSAIPFLFTHETPWDLSRSTSPCSPARLLPPSAMQVLRQELLRCLEFLTAILNIKPRPRSQQRSALTGGAQDALFSPTSQCCLLGALWRLPDLPSCQVTL